MGDSENSKVVPSIVRDFEDSTFVLNNVTGGDEISKFVSSTVMSEEVEKSRVVPNGVMGAQESRQ